MGIGDFIKKRRQELGLARWALFKASEVSTAYIKLIEEGKNTPKPDVLRRLAKPLNVSYIELMIIAGYVDPSDVLRASKIELEQKYKDLAMRISEITPPSKRAAILEIIEKLLEL